MGRDCEAVFESGDTSPHSKELLFSARPPFFEAPYIRTRHRERPRPEQRRFLHANLRVRLSKMRS